MSCSNCGAANPTSQKFCGECGARLALACAACGSPLPPGQKFCGECGAATSGSGQATASSTRGPAPVAERRQVSVLFADLVGFTPFAEERDAEAVRDTLSRYFTLASDVIVRYGGTVEKFIGDAVMAIWGAPTAHEDDAERAVRAGLELVDAIPSLGPGIAARAGVLTGEAAVTLGALNQGMVAGDLVNTAARLQSVAPSGTVLVGETTRDAAGRAIVFEEAGPQLLKGKLAPVPAWRAVRVVAERGGAGRSDGLEAPFVGRADELRMLKEQFHATGRERRARLVSVVGQAGIGKSRLAWELEKYLDGVVETVRWHRGRSLSYGEGVTFWALGEMVRRRAGLAEVDDEATTRAALTAMLAQYVAEADERRWLEPRLLTLLGLEDAPSGGREELFAAWRTFFERLAADGTVVMVFEDLQWADDGLLDFVEHLLDWSGSQPLFVVSLARPELLDRRPGWGTDRRGAVAMRLGPLPEEAMRELLAGLVPGLPEAAATRILARADGFPLYAVETVRMLVADGRLEPADGAYRPVGDLGDMDVPGTLHALVAARLDALPPLERTLMQEASVLGQTFTLEALCAVTGDASPAQEARLASLRRRELLAIETDPRAPTRGQHAFVQALVREVAYGTLSRRERRGRHLAAARYLEGLGDDELAGVLATHYLAAYRAAPEGPEGEAAAAQARISLRASADRAESLGSLVQAADALRAALEVTTDPRERAATLQRIGWNRTLASRYSDGEPTLTDAVEAWTTLGDQNGALHAVAQLASSQMARGQIGLAKATIEAHLAAAEALADNPDGAEGLAWFAEAAGRVAFRSSRNEEAVVWCDRALRIAEPRRMDYVISMALITKAVAMPDLGRVREGNALQMGAYLDAGARGLHVPRLRAGVNLAAQGSDDDPGRSLKYTLEGIEDARRLGLATFSYYHAGNLATPARRLGLWDMALAALTGLEESAGPETVEVIEQSRAELLAWRGVDSGDWPERMIAAAQAAQDPQQLANGYFVAIDASYIRGDFDAAVSFARQYFALDSAFGGPRACFQVGRAALLARDLNLAEEARARMATQNIAGGALDSDMAVLNAGIAAVRGDAEAAATGYRVALAGYREFGLRFDFALTVVDMAALLGPDHPSVRSSVAEARETLVALGAVPILARLDRLMGAGSSGAAQTLRTTAAPSATSA